MAKRFKLPKARSKQMFSAAAKAVHPKNNRAQPMRGGIRL